MARDRKRRKTGGEGRTEGEKAGVSGTARPWVLPARAGAGFSGQLKGPQGAPAARWTQSSSQPLWSHGCLGLPTPPDRHRSEYHCKWCSTCLAPHKEKRKERMQRQSGWKRKRLADITQRRAGSLPLQTPSVTVAASEPLHRGQDSPWAPASHRRVPGVQPHLQLPAVAHLHRPLPLQGPAPGSPLPLQGPAPSTAPPPVRVETQREFPASVFGVAQPWLLQASKE